MVDRRVVEKLVSLVGEAEARMDVEKPKILLTHSLNVARIARIIAEEEGGNGDLAFLAGLLHDYGKLESRIEGRRESEVTIERLKDVLEGSLGELGREIVGVLASVDKIESRAVRDADYISKLGASGLSTFASKWAVRGLLFEEAVISKLPRELTVLYNIEDFMETESGRRLARRLKRRSLKVYKWLLEELGFQGLKLKVLKRRVGGNVVLLILPLECPKCSSSKVHVYKSKMRRGISCLEYITTIKCMECDWEVEENVCLPLRGDVSEC